MSRRNAIIAGAGAGAAALAAAAVIANVRVPPGERPTKRDLYALAQGETLEEADTAVCVQFEVTLPDGRNRVVTRHISPKAKRAPFAQERGAVIHPGRVVEPEQCRVGADRETDAPSALAGDLRCTRPELGSDGEPTGRTETFSVDGDRAPPGADCTCRAGSTCVQCPTIVVVGRDPCPGLIAEGGKGSGLRPEIGR